MTVSFSAATAALLTATAILTPLTATAQPSDQLARTQASDQTEELDPDSVIVVQGYRRTEVRNHVFEVLDVDSEQIARREGPFCPRVVNFPEEYVPIIEARIRENAKVAGVVLAEPGCSANALAVFAREPAQFMDDLNAQYPGVFETLYRPERAKLVKPDREVYNWTLTVAKDRYGKTIRSGETVAEFNISRLTMNVVRDLAVTYSVIDIDRTEGMSLRQIADFLSLHMLLDLRSDVAETAHPNSILRLFTYADPADAPPEMSPMDRAFIAGLYSQPRGDRSAAFQRARVVDYIMRRLEEDGLAN